MVEMDLAKRNRILLSFQAVNDNLQAPIIRRFQNVLGCTTLVLPTLVAMKEHIPTLVHLYLSQVSSGGESEVIDMADEGIRLMQDFPWEHNYSQFKRIMQDLIETAALPIISEACAVVYGYTDDRKSQCHVDAGNSLPVMLLLVVNEAYNLKRDMSLIMIHYNNDIIPAAERL